MLGRTVIILALLGVFNSNVIGMMQKGKGKAGTTSKTAEKMSDSFTATNSSDRYCIEELSIGQYRNVIELLKQHVPEEDPTLYLFGVHNDEDSLKIFQDIWMEILLKNMSLGCFKCDTREMVGVTLLYIQNKNNINGFTPIVPTPQLTNVQNLMSQIDSTDIFTKFNVENYLSGSIYVLPKYRSLGIEQKLLKIREQVCKKHYLQLSSSVFIMDYENNAADDVGFIQSSGKSYRQLSTIIPAFNPRFGNIYETNGIYRKSKYYPGNTLHACSPSGKK